jgi:hypothetical protein
VVAAGSKEVKIESETMISCVISGLAAQATVEWLDKTGTAVSGPAFTPDPGIESGGTQTSTLLVKGAAVKADTAYTCRVKSTSLPNSEHSDTSVDLDVYGEIKKNDLHDSGNSVIV